MPAASGRRAPRIVRDLTRATVVADGVRLADSFGSRFVGLMRHPGLAPGEGLWLTGTSSIHMLFMRFAIDAVFVGRPGPDGSVEVLAVRENLRPWTGIVWLVRGADACLELASGGASAGGVRAGDRLRFEGPADP